MKYKLTTNLQGPDVGYNAGDEITDRDFSSDEIKRFVAAGFAVPVRAEKKEVTKRKPSAKVEKAAD